MFQRSRTELIAGGRRAVQMPRLYPASPASDEGGRLLGLRSVVTICSVLDSDGPTIGEHGQSRGRTVRQVCGCADPVTNALHSTGRWPPEAPMGTRPTDQIPSCSRLGSFSDGAVRPSAAAAAHSGPGPAPSVI